MLWSAVTELAGGQYGLVATRQMVSLGGTEEEIRWAERRGRIDRVRTGVYAVAGAPEVDQRAQMAAILACGPKAALSDLAAAGAHGAEQVKSGLLQVTTFDRIHHRHSDITLHTSRLDFADAVTTCGDLPVVVPGLAVVQCAKTCHPYLVERIANDLVKKNVTTFAEMLLWIDKAHDGRRPYLRELCLKALDVGGHYDSPPCRELCHRLSAAGARGYETDYEVVDAEGIMRVDIVWPPPKVGIEYNGRKDHDNRVARAKDARRRNRLAAAGWTMLEADGSMSFDDIVAWALRALAVASSATR